MASRPMSGSTSRVASSGKRPSSGKAKPKNVTQDFLSKEEEYKRLNAELEERTISLLKEAEEVFQDQESLLNKPAFSDLSVEDERFDNHDDGDLAASFSSASSKPRETNNSNTQARSKSVASQGAASRPVSRTKKQTNRPQSRNKNTTSAAEGKLSKFTGHDINLDLFDDKVSLAHTISTLEDEAKDATYTTTLHDNVLPQGAEEMGSEATIRFLKAKLRVMQEEMDLMSAECSKKDEKIDLSESKVKELTDEQSRIHKTNQSLQIQIDKYKKLIDESKKKTESLETQISSLKKELDSLQREQKQAATNKNAVEVRLNRALEEVEKYKGALQKTKTASKDTNDQERKRVEQLIAENKRLEKQKAELMTGFKKQMKLIDILKRQKMHIEAAKLLSFTEEEFVKALDWGN